MNLNETFIRGFELDELRVLRIHQSVVGDVGCVVWDAALVTAKYLVHAFQDNQSGKSLQNANVVELGAGTGIVGLTAAALGANVTITDLAEFVPLMEKNIECNLGIIKNGQIKACELRWGDPVDKFSIPDYILVSDCVYYSESLGSLVTTLCNLSDSKTTVLFSYEERSSKQQALTAKFFKCINEHFSCEKVPEHQLHPEFYSPDIHVLILKKKR